MSSLRKRNFKHLARQFAFGDVVAIADIADELAGCVVARRAFILNPAVFAGMMAQAVVHAELLAPVEGRYVGFQAAFKIVRMDAFGPAIAELLFQAAAGKVEPALVEVVALLVDASRPDQRLSRVGKRAEVLFALDELAFDPVPLADQVVDAEHDEREEFDAHQHPERGDQERRLAHVFGLLAQSGRNVPVLFLELVEGEAQFVQQPVAFGGDGCLFLSLEATPDRR